MDTTVLTRGLTLTRIPQASHQQGRYVPCWCPKGLEKLLSNWGVEGAVDEFKAQLLCPVL